MTPLLVAMWSFFYHFSAVTPVSPIPAPVCSLLSTLYPDFQADGDFIIGGVFPIHYGIETPEPNFTYKPAAPQCWGFNLRIFLLAQSMRLAIEEINQSQNLLPNFTLGYKIHDSCTTPVTAQAAVLAVLNGPRTSSSTVCSAISHPLAVVGEYGSSTQASSKLPPCAGLEPLLEQHSAYLKASNPTNSFNAYKAVYAIAHSLKNLISCKPGKGPFHNSSCADVSNIQPWQLLHYLEEVSFTLSGEEVLVSVCSESCAPGSRKAVRRGEPLCCFDCVPCDGGKISNETGWAHRLVDGGWFQTDAVESKACLQSAVAGGQAESGSLLWELQRGDSDFQADGDFIIGGIFPMHYGIETPKPNFTYKPAAPQCWGFNLRMFLLVQSIRLAVEEINQSQNLLPNFTLGYKIHDSCTTPVTAQAAALAVLNGPRTSSSTGCSAISHPLAVVGDYGSTQTIVISKTLRPFRIPLEKALEILNIMKRSSARVVVVFAVDGELALLLKDYMEQNITGIQWIATEGWSTASLLSGSEFYPFLGGTIGYAQRQGHVPGLRDYLMSVNPLRYPNNPLVHEMWGALHGCSLYPSSNSTQASSQLPHCAGLEPLLEQHSAYLKTSNHSDFFNAYRAVYAIAHSLQNLISCKPGKGPFHNSSCADVSNIQPWQVIT
ncbi:hypothetical protein SKAU_G00077890 [Synaphobranchus kaupii]|uniref:Extracellular calcium-sensing receptor n=1 Tax=Synaphobranchus kaupii TaxID=118154 RepID=A0A9Q1FV19_SYNKA|nr:hypothetical protein SKAU_G00077890 [Synaphobranchus kaupii]